MSVHGVGTTDEIEKAHLALDLMGVPDMPLALRILNVTDRALCVEVHPDVAVDPVGELIAAVAAYERTLDGHPWDAVDPKWSRVSAALDRVRLSGHR